MKVRLMSSNIWGDYFGNEVAGRDCNLEQVYRKYLPDVLGLQEMTQSWWDSPIWKNMKDEYQFVPVPTEGQLNYVPMLYRHKTLEVIDSGWHLYHKELDASKGYTWAAFRRKADGMRFVVFNTHFMWRGEKVFDVVRRYNAMELHHAMKEVRRVYGFDTFFMGDLNCVRDSLAWDYLESEGWETSFMVADECSAYSSHHGDPERGEDQKFHGKMTPNPKELSIDHIGVCKKSRILKQEAVADTEAMNATDHFPIYIDVDL